MNRDTLIKTALPTILLLVLAVVSVGPLTFAAVTNAPPVVMCAIDLPASQILPWGRTVLRVDSTTGAVYELISDPTSIHVSNTWEELVGPVKSHTSGMLQIQIVERGDQQRLLFLIDASTGDSWILKQAGPDATWQKLEVKKS